MAEHAKPIDISGMPDLLHVVEQVRASNEPRILTRDDEQLAVIVPVGARFRGHRQTTPTEEDLEAFRSAAGGWKGVVDVDKLVEDIYESRRISSRPPVEL
jgi:hypothetical protein